MKEGSPAPPTLLRCNLFWQCEDLCIGNEQGLSVFSLYYEGSHNCLDTGTVNTISRRLITHSLEGG